MLLTRKEAAELLRVTPETITRWAMERQVPFLKFGPKTYRYEYEALMEWAKANAEQIKRGGAK